MTINLVDIIQKNLQYPELKKIDPNTQDIKDKGNDATIDLLAQAAIPSVLTGLYKLTRNNEGCLKILEADRIEDSLSTIFDGKENPLVEKITQYAGFSANQVESHLENIADEAIRLIKEFIPDKTGTEKLKHFMNDQRHMILVYLPAALNLGDLLKDDGLDDRTNKMEGPVSNFMHKIENKLSQGGS